MPKKKVNRKFGLPVQEAKEHLTVKLLQVDIDKAQEVKPDDVNAKENFLSCVIAQATTRTLGEGQAAIMRRVAYVAYPGEKVPHTKRYLIDEGSHDVLSRWDRGEHIVEGVELRLRAPNPKHTLRELRKKNATYTKAKSGQKRPITARKQRKSDPLHSIVRNGNLVRWD
jgi:hypothetical protein